MKLHKFFVFTILIFISPNSFSFSPEKLLPEKQEHRARELFLQINCPVCAGQVIESSDTEVSFQLRKLVREEIISGKSDDEIKSDLVKKYGSNILNSIPPSKENFLLWILPALFLVVGLIWLRKEKLR
ncbi:MAG: cytochrome c-type biogenesis protein CcmH [Lentimonas sp.]|jgi:cytochrome c-type biogenesis protein CcmH